MIPSRAASPDMRTAFSPMPGPMPPASTPIRRGFGLSINGAKNPIEFEDGFNQIAADLNKREINKEDISED